MRRWAGIAGCLALLLGTSTPSWARVESPSEYSKAQTFSGALRYLRVDLGYEVVERDEQAAYLLFRYPVRGRAENAASGSIEVVETQRGVRLFVQLPQAPEYQERMLRDGLLRKLRQEYGTPAPVEPKPPAKPEAPADPSRKQPAKEPK